jgi:sugar phosphate permease
MANSHQITDWLKGRKSIIPTIYISLVAFLTYACMYGIRKPFTVAEFHGLDFFGY